MAKIKGFKLEENLMREISKNKHGANLKLSIIIPVYNTEKYVGECLDSCLEQDIPRNEYEIICVDDGSTDGSRKVLATYSEKYSNIHVYSQKNQGVSAARNGGISVAQGKYIWFVDSDDYIAVNCLKILLGAMEQYNAETCMFGRQTTANGIESAKPIDIKSIKLSDKRKTSMFVTNTIFSKNTLVKNNILFPLNMQHGEDTYFSYIYSLFEHSNKLLLVDGVMYYYRIREGSALHTRTFDELNKRTFSHVNMAIAYREILNEKAEGENIDINDLKRRISMAVSAAMFSASGNKGYDINRLLSKLKELGLYPYKLDWKSLRPAYNWKATIIDWCRFLFPFESYYKLFTYIIRKIH